MRLGGGHFKSLGIVPRAVATVAVWAIAAAMEVRLRAPFVGMALGAIAVCVTLVIWLSKGEEAE